MRSPSARPIVFLFSGQGSQYYGMGQPLRAEHPGFAARLEALDRIASQAVGRSILDIVYDEATPGNAVFDRLLYSHPAILMIELALAGALRDAGVEPDYVLGTSLGELAAASVAGVVDEEVAIRAAIEQARLAELHCPPGGMIAILHDSALAQEPVLAGNCEVIGISYDSHFVVAGTPGGLANVLTFLTEREIAHHRLPVRYPFHTSLVDAASDLYRNHLSQLALRTPRVPIASCVRGTILHALPQDYFWSVAREPILFREAVAALEQTGKRPIYVDLSPASSLAGFLGRELAAPSVERILPLMSPFHRKTRARFDNVVAQCIAARHTFS